jgi:hypothetical protein
MTDAEKSQAIKRHLAVLGLKQKDVADILGVTRVTVSNLINQPRFGKKTAYAWHSAFGFSVDFLVNGTGPVLSSDAVREPGTITQNITGNSGIAVQQTGGTTNAATGKEAPVQTEGGSATEGYFARLCRELLQHIIDKDDEICCLKEEIQRIRQQEGRSDDA